jgi:acyl-CoA synthetase (AMP-forming)/AMP-acid ligase II
MQPADMRRALSHEPHLLESVGQVSTLFEISIRSEDGRPLPPGEAGEIWLKSPANMAGYLHRPDQTAEAILDGWLRTNDIGRLDAEGFLYLLDRRNFVIISGGINVYPVVVEAALAEHPAILEACVVGIPHPVWGEAIVAAVVCREGAEIDPDALRSHSRERLNRVQVPKHFHILDEPLPRTSTGKVRKLEVRDRLAAMPHLFAWNRPGS